MIAVPTVFDCEPLHIVTSYGEFNKVHDPDEAEIDIALASLMDDKRPIIYSASPKRYSALQHFGNWATHWAKAALFKLMSILENDPLNFRYTYQIKSKPGYRDFFGYRCMRFFDYDWETKAQSSSLPSLFIPLSLIPELSTDYWLKDLKYVDYERFILDSCRGLTPYYQILVKDHWFMIGHKRREFYEQLKQIPGVILIPADVNGRLVMQKVDRILVGAGMSDCRKTKEERDITSRVATAQRVESVNYSKQGICLKLIPQ